MPVSAIPCLMRVWSVAERQHFHDAVKLLRCLAEGAPRGVRQQTAQGRGSFRGVTGPRHHISRFFLVLHTGEAGPRIEIKQLPQGAIADLLVLAKIDCDFGELLRRQMQFLPA